MRCAPRLHLFVVIRHCDEVIRRFEGGRFQILFDEENAVGGAECQVARGGSGFGEGRGKVCKGGGRARGEEDAAELTRDGRAASKEET